MTLYISKPELFAAAARFVSTEQARPYLNGVAIQPCPNGGAFIIATNGHAMFVAIDDNAEWHGESKESAIWHVAKPKLPASAFKAFGLSLDGVTAQFMAQDGTPAHVIACRKDTSNTFPDWTRIIPDTTGATIPLDNLAFDAAYIADFAAVTKQLNTSRKTAFVARVSNENGPALISIGGRRDCFGVLIPMRIGASYETGHANGIAAKEWITGQLRPARAIAAE